MADPILLTIENFSCYMRNVHTRFPFRYGKASLESAPILHTRLTVRGADGARVEGVSADTLPPKWFDKDPAKDYRQNVADLLAAVAIAHTCYQDAGQTPKTAFQLWYEADPATRERADEAGLNGLTAQFGSSILERAIIDAACRLAHTDYHSVVRSNQLGIQPGMAHPELEGMALHDVVPGKPLSSLYIRHTVGMADPLTDQEIAPEDQRDDGIPHSLEAWCRSAGIRYFKIKMCGDSEQDCARLRRITEVLQRSAPADFQITLDGNEVFANRDAFTLWKEKIYQDGKIAPLLERLMYIEQPLERTAALHAPIRDNDHPDEPPVILDESDDSLDAFRVGVTLGYQGISVKNCKGVMKGLLNGMLLHTLNAQSDRHYFLTGEDLVNLPVVPLHQDLASLGVLGVTHAERNGHHYWRGLDHLSEAEQQQCLSEHASLYEPFESGGRLRIVDGQIDLRSLWTEGYGGRIQPDFESMTPLRDWSFDSL